MINPTPFFPTLKKLIQASGNLRALGRQGDEHLIGLLAQHGITNASFMSTELTNTPKEKVVELASIYQDMLNGALADAGYLNARVVAVTWQDKQSGAMHLGIAYGSIDGQPVNDFPMQAALGFSRFVQESIFGTKNAQNTTPAQWDFVPVSDNDMMMAYQWVEEKPQDDQLIMLARRIAKLQNCRVVDQQKTPDGKQILLIPKEDFEQLCQMEQNNIRGQSY